ncbi:hypothetical protein PPL_05346 [Heterostelium album PN500]|uniref:Uncharacterized protein n=1 Tax=Heterostelium pallidum (strain ATCC 26659 / Pp 5 / PN500) TaxID=670386 RepID=D3B9X6_HETP5|nr:hypothetical protein PPL_05346 [Heterostelium album PN500]EFA81363.1 hypothetical protein PPL_05346 [Heterostelium album PN500]|eukprot:XP_020433481.1 hypothetical protein PPL_05346 [Heterostelium album PN500]
MNNYIIQSKPIQNKIVNYLLDENIQTVLSFSEYLSEIFSSYRKSFRLYEKHKYLNNLIIDYSLVCRNWYSYISNSLNRFNYSPILGPISGVLTPLRNQYSLIQCSNITTLSLVQRNSSDLDRTIKLISQFPSLQLLCLYVDSIAVVMEIIKHFPDQFKIQIALTLSSPDESEVYDIPAIRSKIDFIHFNVYQYEMEYASLWQPDSLYFLANRFSSMGNSIDMSKFLSIPTLQHINVCEVDIIDLQDLKSFVENNNTLVSLKAVININLVAVKYEHFYSGEHSSCRCKYCQVWNQLNTHSIISANRADHWIDFCNALQTNKTLKRLSIKNCCQISTMLASSDLATTVSNRLSEALSSNNTLRDLSISCLMLNDSFFRMTLSHSNRSIKHLKLFDLDKQFLIEMGEMLKVNQTITYIDAASFYLQKYNSNEQFEAINKLMIDTNNNKIIRIIKISSHIHAMQSDIQPTDNFKIAIVESKKKVNKSFVAITSKQKTTDRAREFKT